MSKSIPEIIKDFFKSKESELPFYTCVFRNDGVVIYKNSSKIDESSIGALMGGVWQAATALASFIPEEKKIQNNHSEIFRFSFDTSSSGIYILPLKFDKFEYYLGVIYCNEINPGFLKNKMRDLSLKFFAHVSERYKPENKTVTTSRSQFLFTEISDEEIDKMFGIVGN